MRKRGKSDSNQKKVIKMLRCIPGVTVKVTSSLGDGFGDFLVGYRKVNYLIELKNDAMIKSKRRLTKDEEKFHSEWTGQIDVCETFEDCLSVIGVKN